MAVKGVVAAGGIVGIVVGVVGEVGAVGTGGSVGVVAVAVAAKVRRIFLAILDLCLQAVRNLLCGGKKLTLLGQSFGGFCILTYLSLFPGMHA